MLKLLRAVVAVLVVAAACSASSPAGPQSRTVLVDYSHDEFASFFLAYYPREVTIRPGDTLEFKQTWTGEPHSVTMGTIVDELGDAMRPYLEAFREGGWEAVPEEEPPEIAAIFERLPWMFGERDDDGNVIVGQGAAQPCYLDEGTAPPVEPCPKDKQLQPPFNGRQSYYNSGFIPYEGPRGNTFTMTLADDIEPGRYFYYCNLHGPFMSGDVVVEPKGSTIESQRDVNRRALAEIDKDSGPLRDAFRDAVAGKMEPPEEALPWLRKRELVTGSAKAYFLGNIAGLYADETVGVDGGINEFVPREIKTKVGEKVAWVMVGEHSISFNVPEYFPIIEIDEDGTVKRNPQLDPPAGGAPDPPQQEHGEDVEGPPEPLVIDGGVFDGTGFWSSGLIGAEPFLVYELRFSKPGNYRYACLIHPPMVGTVQVSG